jgi:predicted alpha-1,2-mannosidase
MIFKKIKKLLILISLVPSLTDVFAGTDNIAPLAKVSASSTLNKYFKAENIKDGIIGVDNKGEWACEGVATDWGYVRFPWIQLDWDQPHLVNRIILYDRHSATEHIAGGKLVFSDGSIIWVDEIPNDGTAKVVNFAAKNINSFRFVTTDGKGKDIGFSEIEVYTERSSVSDYVSWVDPYIETNRGRYFFFIPGSRPFGMVGAAPHTRNKNQNGGGYNYNENEILGFGQIHTWMISGIEVMPANNSVDPTKGEAAWKSVFSHDEELVQPGYQRVFLRQPKTWVELTSTDRVSFYRFRYQQEMQTQVLVNLGGYLGNSTMANANIHIVNNKEFEGSISSIKRYWGGPKDVKIYFVVQFDREMKSVDGWKGSKLLSGISRLNGDSAGIAAKYDVKPGEEIKMKISISYTSIENARKNMSAECSTWDFDAVRNDSRNVWNDWLGKIAVKGGDHDQKIKFYTDLWHVLLGRQKINDVSGDYPDRTKGRREDNFTDAVFTVKTLPKDTNGKPRFNMYNSDAFWLTQWNLNILWGLAWPEVLDEMSSSMIQYADNGGLLPRGPSGGGYSYIMTSDPAVNLIAGTFQMGLLTKIGKNHAYEVMKRNQMPGGMLGSKDEINFYIKHGWWKDNAGITVEAVFQDWALAQMAYKLGKKKDYHYFLKRSEGWKNCFNASQGLLFPKDSSGKFIHNNPLSGEGWVEANAWQASFGVSHDIPGLATLMGGNLNLCNKLNFAFEKAAPEDFVFAYTNGFVSYANQPGLSNAHVFNYAGEPWLTQYWVRRVREQAYGGITPDLGYGGQDEDQGQMGALSSMMAIGLFSLQGNVSATPVYEITSPIFDSIIIKLDPFYYKGKHFNILTHNNSKENRYIQKTQLNGNELNNFWFTHETYSKGGTLEIWLGNQPNKSWGIGGLPPVTGK